MILTFRRGTHGYKMRCPGCKAVVRLRVDNTLKPARGPSVRCPCGLRVPVGDAATVQCPNCYKTLMVPGLEE